MIDHPNLERARAGYQAFASGDMATLSELLSDDVVWHIGGSGALAGDYEGKEAVFGYLSDLMQETEGSFRNEIHDILANDDHGVALVTVSATRGAKSLEARLAHIFHMSDGKMTEFWVFPEDQQLFDEFWA